MSRPPSYTSEDPRGLPPPVPQEDGPWVPCEPPARDTGEPVVEGLNLQAGTRRSRVPGARPASAMLSGTYTRERMRILESEVRNLRLNMEEERTINARLKRQVEDKHFSSASNTTIRDQKLRNDVKACHSKNQERPVRGLFKRACSTDLLFLIDTTGSMAPHIEAARRQIKSIVRDIHEAFFNQAEVRVAVVGYKDHYEGINIEFLDFTESANRVYTFLGTLEATGGGDTPEDVLGGLQRAINASWLHQTRCIIHIADAPPHGRGLQNPGEGPLCDRWPELGSEPHKLTHSPLLKRMIDLKINYAFLRINDLTDHMVFTFSEVYRATGADCKILNTNLSLKEPDYRSTVTKLDAPSELNPRSGLLFQEFELGTSYTILQHLVLKTVTSSASRTAVRLSSAPPYTSGGKFRGSRLVGLPLDLGPIAELKGDPIDEALEDVDPIWNNPFWFQKSLQVEGFSPDVIVHDGNTLNDMMASEENIKMGVIRLNLRTRKRPFAEGALRRAYYARTGASTNCYVVKSSKRNGKQLADLAEDMSVQALCKAFALEFNAFSGEKEPLDFVVTSCLREELVSGEETGCISLEPFIAGDYVKYNNNSGWVNEEIPNDEFNRAAQAFSHFTFERSEARFLVADLQGVKGMLTDPSVHAVDVDRYTRADTNLGMEGMKMFFLTHKCNSICKRLGLKSKSSMIALEKYSFRTNWPTLEKTVCCSNKLCGRIIHLSDAKRTAEYADYLWCDTCWPQLKLFSRKWICPAPGPHHEYEVSKFFHESQGKLPPRKCAEHGKKDDLPPEFSMWTRFAAANPSSRPATCEPTTRSSKPVATVPVKSESRKCTAGRSETEVLSVAETVTRMSMPSSSGLRTVSEGVKADHTSETVACRSTAGASSAGHNFDRLRAVEVDSSIPMKSSSSPRREAKSMQRRSMPARGLFSRSELDLHDARCRITGYSDDEDGGPGRNGGGLLAKLKSMKKRKSSSIFRSRG